MARKKTYFKMSPELVDGQNSEICGDRKMVLERVQNLLEEFKDEGAGFRFSVETVAMTAKQFDELAEL